MADVVLKRHCKLLSFFTIIQNNDHLRNHEFLRILKSTVKILKIRIFDTISLFEIVWRAASQAGRKVY